LTNKLKPGSPETWAKLKYDRQIAAIAVTRRVECIYSTDGDLEQYADQLGMKFRNLQHLPLPPSEQQELALEEVQAKQTESAATVSSADDAKSQKIDNERTDGPK
jgi:hypothetical protein